MQEYLNVRQGTWIEAEMPGMGTFLKFSHRSLTL